jgi:hypothetical protein
MIMAKEEETCKQQESSHTLSHPQNFQKNQSVQLQNNTAHAENKSKRRLINQNLRQWCKFYEKHQ